MGHSLLMAVDLKTVARRTSLLWSKHKMLMKTEFKQVFLLISMLELN